MDSVKILHTADLHLDSRFYGLSAEKSKLRRQELKTSFSEALKECCDADIVLICGDLIDNPGFSRSSVTFLTNTFASYPDTTFFVVLGNHDPCNSAAALLLRSSLPENVVLFSDKAEYMELDELKVRVYGMSFSDKQCFDSMMNEFKVIDDDYINILMLHGDIAGKLSQSKYNPITAQQLEYSGFDYVALGHVHNSDGIHLAGRTYYAYSGTHEPHGFDECGPKGVIYGQVGKGFCRLAHKITSLRTYNDIELDVTSARTFEELLDMIRYASDDSKSFYRIKLTGTLADGICIDCALLESMVDVFYIKITDCTHHSYNLDEISCENGLKGFVARNILKELESCEDGEVDIVCAASDYLFELIDNGD